MRGNVFKDRLIDNRAYIVYGCREQHRNNRHEYDLHDVCHALLLDRPAVPAHKALKRRKEREEQKRDEEESHQRTGTGSERSACRTVGLSIILRVPEKRAGFHSVVEQDVGSHDGYSRVYYLLYDLAGRRGNHGSESLKKSAYRSEHRDDQHGGRQYLQRKNSQRRLHFSRDKSRSEENYHHAHAACDERKNKRSLKYFKSVLPLPFGHPCRYKLRNGDRQRIGGNEQKHIVYLIRCGIVVISAIADDRRHRNPVYQSYSPAYK